MERGIVAGLRIKVGGLSPSHRGTCCSSDATGHQLALRRPASASWVLREAKQVAPTTRLAGHEPSKSLRSARVPLGATPSMNYTATNEKDG